MIDLDSVFENKKFEPEHIKSLEEIGFFFWNNCSDYTDFEAEVTIKEATENNERESLNLHVTFDWMSSNVYVQLGCNLGEGFDSHLHVPFETRLLKETIEKYIKETELATDFESLLSSNPEQLRVLLESVDSFDNLVKSSFDCEGSQTSVDIEM